MATHAYLLPRLPHRGAANPLGRLILSSNIVFSHEIGVLTDASRYIGVGADMLHKEPNG